MKANSGALVGTLAIIMLFVMGYLITTILSGADKVITELDGKEPKIYHESIYQVTDWDLDREEGFLFNDDSVVFHTIEKSHVYYDYRVVYIESERDYSYLSEVSIENLSTNKTRNLDVIVALTSEDLKEYSKAYASEFKDELKVEAEPYEEYLQEIIENHKETDYTREYTEHVEVL